MGLLDELQPGIGWRRQIISTHGATPAPVGPISFGAPYPKAGLPTSHEATQAFMESAGESGRYIWGHDTYSRFRNSLGE